MVLYLSHRKEIESPAYGNDRWSSVKAADWVKSSLDLRMAPRPLVDARMAKYPSLTVGLCFFVGGERVINNYLEFTAIGHGPTLPPTLHRSQEHSPSSNEDTLPPAPHQAQEHSPTVFDRAQGYSSTRLPSSNEQRGHSPTRTSLSTRTFSNLRGCDKVYQQKLLVRTWRSDVLYKEIKQLISPQTR